MTEILGLGLLRLDSDTLVIEDKKKEKTMEEEIEEQNQPDGDADNDDECGTKKKKRQESGSGEENDIDGGKKKKKMDYAESAIGHMDTINGPEWMTSSFTRTPEGYLSGRAIVSNVGVFTYILEDGTVRRELRLPEEVFALDSIKSLTMKPVTNDHPKEIVTIENIKQYQVGITGTNPAVPAQWADGTPKNPEFLYLPGHPGVPPVGDTYHLAIDMVIQDESTIGAVLEGKRALSCGYTADLEMAAGVWCGIPYDAIQRNIRYNHVAIVDVARAGDAARIRIDAAQSGVAMMVVQKTTQEEPMKTIKLDGVEYQAEAEVIKVLTQRTTEVEQLKTDAAEVQKKLEKAEADRDTLQARVDAAEKELKELKDAEASKERVDAAVKSRMELMAKATQAGVELKGDEDDRQIKEAVIMKAYPTLSLDGRSDDYVQACFDNATTDLHKEDTIDDEKSKKTGGEMGITLEGVNTHKDAGDPDAARQKMVNRNRGQEKGV